MAAQPPAADHRRGRLAATDRRHHPARPAVRSACCATSMARAGWSADGALPAAAIAGSNEYLRADVRRQTAGRPLSAPLRRRCRPRPGRALVGAERPHPGAVRRRLCAGKPPGAVARLFQPLQVDERRARGAVLRGIPRRPARQRRPRRAAHRLADARPLQRDLFRARHTWRAISASCWSRATTSPSAATASISAPSPA